MPAVQASWPPGAPLGAPRLPVSCLCWVRWARGAGRTGGGSEKGQRGNGERDAGVEEWPEMRRVPEKRSSAICVPLTPGGSSW